MVHTPIFQNVASRMFSGNSAYDGDVRLCLNEGPECDVTLPLVVRGACSLNFITMWQVIQRKSNASYILCPAVVWFCHVAATCSSRPCGVSAAPYFTRCANDDMVVVEYACAIFCKRPYHFHLDRVPSRCFYIGNSRTGVFPEIGYSIAYGAFFICLMYRLPLGENGCLFSSKHPWRGSSCHDNIHLNLFVLIPSARPALVVWQRSSQGVHITLVRDIARARAQP